MQRDAYAAFVKRHHERILPLRFIQPDGSTKVENIFADVFRGYKARRLVLMALPTVTKSVVCHPATHAREVVLAAEEKQATIVSSFEALLHTHRPHYVYRLLPLLSTSLDAFAAAQAFCADRYSFFDISDRRDPFSLKLKLATSPSPANRKQLDAFMSAQECTQKENTTTTGGGGGGMLPLRAVNFDAVLCCDRKSVMVRYPIAAPAQADDSGNVAPPPPPPSRIELRSGAALFTVHETISEAAIQQRALLQQFFHSPQYRAMGSNSDLFRLLFRIEALHHECQQRRGGGAVPSVSLPPPHLHTCFFHVMASKTLVGSLVPYTLPSITLTKDSTSRSSSSDAAMNGEDDSSSHAHALLLQQQQQQQQASKVLVHATLRRRLLELAAAHQILLYEKLPNGAYRFAGRPPK